MKIVIDIKSVGIRYGTVGWLKNQISSGEIWFEESNNYYVPIWDSYNVEERTLTHGLVIRDNKHSALIAYRNMDGGYKYNVKAALGCSPEAHWCLNLTAAAQGALEEICEEWISITRNKNEVEENDLNTLDIKIRLNSNGGSGL